MSLFDKKEDVIEIQLTQYGKHLLSRGKFKPSHYAFFDDDILYDAKYGYIEEEQNDVQTRIKETPKRKIQYVFSSRDKAVKELTTTLTNSDERDNPTEEAKTQLMVEKYRLMAMNMPLGTSSLSNNNFPSWSIFFLKGELYSANSNVLGDRIPQLLSNDVLYTTEFKIDNNNLSKKQIEDSLDGSLTMYGDKYEDDSYIVIDEDYLLVDVNELGVDFDGDSFEIEVFKMGLNPTLRTMAYVPAGAFTYGPAGSIETLTTGSFYIDIYEVTAGNYKECVELGGCSYGATTGEADYDTYYTYNNSKDDHPINYVNWQEAVEYCEWQGKRLPTEEEWEKAARGTDGRIYPWGDEAATCDYTVMYEGSDGCGTDSTAPVGSKEDGKSPYGAYDMAGNVWEWTNSRYSSDQSHRVLRGGSFLNANPSLKTTLVVDSDPITRYPHYGFRCAFTAISEKLTPLSFFKKPITIKDGILLDTDNIDNSNVEPPRADPNYVEYWFDISCDYEIAERILCANLPKSETRGSIFSQNVYNCPEEVKTGVVGITSRITEDDTEEEC